MTKNYVFEFIVTVTKEIEIPDGLSEDSKEFELLMDTVGMEMDLSEYPSDFTYYPQGWDWDDIFSPETEPSQLS